MQALLTFRKSFFSASFISDGIFAMCSEIELKTLYLESFLIA